MKSIKKAEGNLKLWIGPFARDGRNRFSTYQLLDNKDIVAIISWENPSGSLATAECFDGFYSLKRGGFLRPNITMRKMGLDIEILRMEISLRKIVLIFRNGNRIIYQNFKKKKPVAQLVDDRDNNLFFFTWRNSPEIIDAKITALGKKFHDLSQVILIIWYYFILKRREQNDFQKWCMDRAFMGPDPISRYKKKGV